MAGYKGWSMSNNAVAAYENGEMPISKWSKKEIIKRIEEAIYYEEIELQCSLEELKKLPLKFFKFYCLEYTSWHHTSKFYNETRFYSLDLEYIEQLTDEDVEERAEYYKKWRKEHRVKRTAEEREAEKVRKAARRAERALIEEKKILFRYQSKYKTLSGFMRSKTVNLDKLRKIRDKMSAESKQKLRPI